MSYPWIKDSQYLIPSVIGYLAVTSPNGLYAASNLNLTSGGDINLDTPSGVVNINGVPYPPVVSADTLQQVLTAGNNANLAILIEDVTTPATLFTQMSDIAFSATDATGSPQYTASVSASSISVITSNGDGIGMNAGSMVIDDTTSTTTYTTAGITAGEVVATSINYSITSNQPNSSPNGYARLDLTSGSSSVPPKVVLNAFQEYPQTSLSNCNNTITLGDNNGRNILIANGDGFNELPENTIILSTDSSYSNNYIQLRSAFDYTGLYSSLTLGIDDFDLTIAQFKAFTISTGNTDPVVFRRNISTTTTDASPNNPVGMLENSVINATTTGTTTLTSANAFSTIINTPTAGTRIFVLPAPTAGSVGTWYAVCNKSTAFTIAVQYPALTTIATIPVAPSATNGGSVARFAVSAGGASYYSVSNTTTNATNIEITDDTAGAGTFYPTFVNSAGTQKSVRTDTTGLTYSPSTDTLTTTNFSGTATRATNIANGLGGQIPYQSAVNTTSLLANGTAGQYLKSNGTTLAPSWDTPLAGSNASTINITDTTTTAGTYYPTFVSATGSTQTLRADSQYLQYNPSTNYLQNPSFLVSNGTETSTTGGLLITTSGIGSKSITSTTTTGATNNTLTIQTTNSGNASSGIYESRQSGTGSGNGVAPYTFPSWSLSSSFNTPVSPVGTPYSTGNFNMLGSCCNMATQLTPNGSENGIVAGFQTSIGDNLAYADMYYNNDQYNGASPYILRLNSAGLLAYGTGTAGTYTFGSPNPTALATTLFSVNSAGVATTNSVTLSNAPTTANQASRLGQVGLVKIGSVSVAITGSASAQNLSFANLFNSSYKNYRIILEPTTQVSFTQYPNYSLQAFLGTGTLPTTANLYGFEMVSTATTIVSPVYTAGATISSAPLVFAVSSNTNKEVIFDIQNVGYANTANQQVSLMCKSVYGNPGVSGASDRTITTTSVSGATITGLVIQQSILSAPNNFTLRAVIYGYNQL